MKKHTYQEVIDASLSYFNGDELAAKVFADKYALFDGEHYLELTPADMHRRLAKEFARIEAKYPNPLSEEEIFDLFDHFKYIVPQGSPMSVIGNPYQIASASNCFVLHSPTDSYAGILKTDQEEAHIMRRRGGVGFDISKIRPKGLPTKNAAKTTDGIGLFMERFSNTCREVAQGGRRGALMLTISCHHPEIRTFINIKRDTKRVTGANISIRVTDEFMNAVKNKEKVQLRWPVDSDNPTVVQYEDAEALWTEMISAVRDSSEPGVLMWDNVLKYTPAHVYKDVGFNTESVNPCFSGDTLVAVADGRNYVSIKQLADEGKDVPVYSVSMEGQVSIKLGRNPRITGYDQDLLRIHLDDGSYVDVTPNHKIRLLNGTELEAKDLKPGQSLPRFLKNKQPVKPGGKDYYLVHCDVNDMGNARVFEHRLIAKYNYPEKWNEILETGRQGGWANTGGLVVHHKDYNSLNNAPDNLEIMTFSEHSKFHAEHDTKGEKNGRYSGITSKELYEHAKKLTIHLNRRFSKKDWMKYAADNNLPQSFSFFREEILGSVTEMAKRVAQELGFDNVDLNPRLLITKNNAEEQGYVTHVVGNQIHVEKKCEQCSNTFLTDFYQRERAFCSNDCAITKYNVSKDIRQARVAKTVSTYRDRSVNLKNNQARIYSELKFNLAREPYLKEWETECKKNGISFRLKTKFGFKNFADLKEVGNNFNHKIRKIEILPGKHTVYNITVDDNHTVAVVTLDDNRKIDGVFLPQCGEIILSPKDSCRLLLINLASYVSNPFTQKARFEEKKFSQHVQIAQKLMDDIIDLELECIDRILAKIASDPESDDIKKIEKDLWTGIREACVNGRRTGLGLTAVGDCLAYLGIRYGSDESIQMVEEIYRQLAVNSYYSSCLMAKERGAFPVFSHELEKGHPFLERIWNAEPDDTGPAAYKLYKKYGRRNIANTTTAPAGSVSILTQTTSGIEPIFLPFYLRRRKINPDSKNVKVDFVDAMGDSWENYKVYHPGVKKWMEVTGETDIEKSPYHKATAMDCDWVAGVKLQAAAQKWICHSISRTANLPEDVSVDTVKAIYEMAWESGCKGYTIYRAGSRSGVLLEDKKEEKKQDVSGRPTKIQPAEAPKRPGELRCDIHSASFKGTKWTVLVGLLEGEPYEMFMGHSDQITLPNKCTSGKIVKQARGTYHLHVDIGDEELIIKDIIKTFDNAESAWATRMISTALRHGTPIDFLVEQLSKDGNINDFNKVISRILKKYIKDGAKVRSSEVCSSCKAGNMIFQEGCMLCTQCGYSKCG